MTPKWFLVLVGIGSLALDGFAAWIIAVYHAGLFNDILFGGAMFFCSLAIFVLIAYLWGWKWLQE